MTGQETSRMSTAMNERVCQIAVCLSLIERQLPGFPSPPFATLSDAAKWVWEIMTDLRARAWTPARSLYLPPGGVISLGLLPSTAPASLAPSPTVPTQLESLKPLSDPALRSSAVRLKGQGSFLPDRK